MRAHNHILELLKEGPECLTAEQLLSLESEALPAADRFRLEQHVAACSHCAAERTLVQNFESAEESMEERLPLAAITAELGRRRAAQWPVAPARKEPFWTRWFSSTPLNTWALVAASLLVMVAGSFYMRGLRTPGLPEVGGDAQIVRSARLVAISPSGELSRPPARFEWKVFEGAQRYRVTVRDVGGTQLWSGESEVATLAFPAQLRARLLPGKTLTWTVEALSGGKVLAASDPVRFVLRPQP